ncbi:MAG: DUF308 domain-containing protein [Phyllobacterium sp.]|uniref:DUF308 domain-containing protein n=1 Tax=Phyllobacterium sp. TaxID=1871046 RepID=UPI0030F01E06
MNRHRSELAPQDQDKRLKLYYFARAAFSVVWVVAALLVGRQSPSVAATLLIVYPVWDAAANYVDASRSGGLAANRTQSFNVAVSLVVALAVVIALTMNMNWVLGAFGVWAILSGLLQLGTAIRRWKTSGGQWAMILSGGQSAVAGTFFIVQAQLPAPPSIADIAGYAGVGALYFLVSAVWLTVSEARRRKTASVEA